MDTSRLIATFSRLQRALRTVFAKPAPQKRLAAPAKPRVAAPVKREFQPTSFVAAAVEIVPAPVADRPKRAVPKIASPLVEAAVATPPAKTMRSLEEVRADLARLRETARERHAQTRERPVDNSFAPTDFMDIPDLGAAPTPASRKKSGSDFASTTFLDFGCPIPLLGR